jgi:hypothetical protein
LERLETRESEDSIIKFQIEDKVLEEEVAEVVKLLEEDSQNIKE